MGREGRRSIAGAAVKIGIAGVIGFGAVATGLLASRRGRKLVREAWEGRRRTRIEDRVLDAIWADRVLGRRAIDAQEVEEGRVALLGQIRSEEERERALAIVGRVKGVSAVEDRLEIVPPRARPVRGLRRLQPQAGEPQADPR
jgi:osmotically-inducible protein OsmY